jgi:transcriptional regulator with XRE-family HTH domain
MSLGTAIKKARIDKQWKQKDLVAATKLSQQYLSEIESDKVDPRVSILLRVACALGVSPNELLAWPTNGDRHA